jgi:hypothetical protein
MRRHTGQLAFLMSHFSKHDSWKLCLHAVSFHTAVLASLSKQIAQSLPSDGAATVVSTRETDITSMWLVIFFL